MMCPKCDVDLSPLETYDNIYEVHKCLNCDAVLFLDYDEYCNDDYSECYEMFLWQVTE